MKILVQTQRIVIEDIYLDLSIDGDLSDHFKFAETIVKQGKFEEKDCIHVETTDHIPQAVLKISDEEYKSIMKGVK